MAEDKLLLDEDDARCPACGGSSWRRWRAVRSRRVIICRRCGLGIQKDPPPSAGELYDDNFYKGDVRYAYVDYGGDEHAHRRNARARLRSLEKLAGGWAGKRVLDVGGAYGFFLDEARRRGAVVEGVEVSAAAATYAREHLGLSVHTGAFAATPLEGDFDVVTMFDYIEHVPDPAGDLARARGLVKPGGVLVLSTGDRAALAARLMGRRWHLIQPDYHLFYFTAPALRAMLAAAGFRVARISRPWRWLSLGAGLEKIAPGARGRGSRTLVYVNLFDIVEVVAGADS